MLDPGGHHHGLALRAAPPPRGRVRCQAGAAFYSAARLKTLPERCCAGEASRSIQSTGRRSPPRPDSHWALEPCLGSVSSLVQRKGGEREAQCATARGVVRRVAGGRSSRGVARRSEDPLTAGVGRYAKPCLSVNGVPIPAPGQPRHRLTSSKLVSAAATEVLAGAVGRASFEAAERGASRWACARSGRSSRRSFWTLMRTFRPASAPRPWRF